MPSPPAGLPAGAGLRPPCRPGRTIHPFVEPQVHVVDLRHRSCSAGARSRYDCSALERSWSSPRCTQRRVARRGSRPRRARRSTSICDTPPGQVRLRRQRAITRAGELRAALVDRPARPAPAPAPGRRRSAGRTRVYSGPNSSMTVPARPPGSSCPRAADAERPPLGRRRPRPSTAAPAAAPRRPPRATPAGAGARLEVGAAGCWSRAGRRAAPAPRRSSRRSLPCTAMRRTCRVERCTTQVDRPGSRRKRTTSAQHAAIRTACHERQARDRLRRPAYVRAPERLSAVALTLTVASRSSHHLPSSRRESRSPTAPIEPAPSVITRSPGRAIRATAAGTSSSAGTTCTGTRAVRRHGVGQRLDRHAGNRILAGRVDVGEHDLVGAAERRPELAPTAGRARCSGAAGTRRARGRRSPARAAAMHGRDLGRVVAVVVDDETPSRLAAHLEAPFGAAEPGHRGRPRSARTAGRARARPRSAASAFSRLCRPGTCDAQRAERRSAGPSRDRRGRCTRPDTPSSAGPTSTMSASMRPPSVVEAVGDHAARHARQQLRARRGVVGAGDDRAVERHLVGEVDERLLQVLEARRSSRGARGRCW